MIDRIRFWLCFGAASVALSTSVPASSPVERDANGHPALAEYVARDDPEFDWHVRSRGDLKGCSYVEILMTSQVWRGVPWRHQLYVVRPSTVEPTARQGILIITGGRWKPELEQPPTDQKLPRNSHIFRKLAEAVRAPVAVLRQVPFQPLFDGKTEDWIIAHTFDQFLESGDTEWPLLLPMVKSAVRAMDVVQEVAVSEWSQPIDTFTVTGASKRGWTTWLTGAVDPRAVAIAPIVIDVLNMVPHLQLAHDSWGALSERIRPYTEQRLHERLTGPAGEALLQIVDPYSYRGRLTQPKLVINGTNDAYWPIEALNLYWDDLAGEKYVLYVPNQGHSIRDYKRVIGAVLGLHRHMTTGPAMPKLDWKYEEHDGRLALSVWSDPAPDRIRVWMTASRTRDLRDAHWSARPMSVQHGIWRLETTGARNAYRALFAEAEYRDGRKLPLNLSTTLRVLAPDPDGGTVPFGPTARRRGLPGPPGKW